MEEAGKPSHAGGWRALLHQPFYHFNSPDSIIGLGAVEGHGYGSLVGLCGVPAILDALDESKYLLLIAASALESCLPAYDWFTFLQPVRHAGAHHSLHELDGDWREADWAVC